MKILKIAAFLILTLCIAGTVFAGGGRQQSSAARELNIVYSGSLLPHEKEYFVDVFAKNFENKNGVKVNVELITQADCLRKIESEQSTGNIITDVVYLDTAWVGYYVNGGWMQDIKGKGHPGTTITTMFDHLLSKNGAQYFIPTDFDVYILAANVESIKYLPPGVTRQDVVNGITWEQYAQWAINIARGEGVGKTMMPGNNQGSQLLYPMGGMGLAYGGSFPDFTSDGFKKGLELIATMAAGNAFYPEQAQYTAPTDPMRNLDVWLTFAHMGPIGVAYNAAPNGWVIGAAPRGSRGAGTMAGAWVYGIQKGARNQELAELWLDYVTTPQVNYDFCSTRGLLSPINESSALFRPGDVIMAAGNKMLNTAIISGVPAVDYTDWNAVKLLYHEAFNQTVSARQVPSDAFLRDLEARCRALRN
jgi:multiple sugar transport system substrate-binding protein